MQKLNIAIAGCGVAGLAVALFLDRQGHAITLFDRFKTPEAIGSGLILQPTGLNVLDRLGILDKVLSHGIKLKRLFGQSLPTGRIVLDVRYERLGSHVFGLSVHRANLFHALFDALTKTKISLESGIDIIEAKPASSEQVVLVDKKAKPYGPFDLCIDALGAFSPLRQIRGGQLNILKFGALWTNVPWREGVFDSTALEQRYHKASVMVGVLPIGTCSGLPVKQAAFFWSILHQDYENWRRQGLTAWKDNVMKAWPETECLLTHIQDQDQMILARYAHTAFCHPVKVHTVAIGDAAHATSPQLGQGANMALIDAAALANALERRINLEDALEAYARARHLHRRAYQFISRIFTPFYQSHSQVLPAMRDSLFRPVSQLRPIAWALAHLVSGSLLPPEW